MADNVFDRSRTLAYINVDVGEGTTFDMHLTRVPSLGEEVNREERSYKVVRVQHEPLNHEGWARFGWEAFVTAELLPEDPPAPRKRKTGISLKRKQRSAGSSKRRNS